MSIILKHNGNVEVTGGTVTTDGDVIPANDPATEVVVNRFWSGTQAEYDDLATYDPNTIFFIV